MSLIKKQLAKTRAELVRKQRAEAWARLGTLRTELKGAKATRKERMKRVGEECRSNRRSISERAQAAREQLNLAIKLERAQAKQTCSVSRDEARSELDPLVGRARSLLEGERASQRQLAAWTKPTATTTRISARERSQESDDQVRANIDDSQLWPVWERMKHKIKARGRTTRTEAFAEWVASHSAEVYEIQNAALESEIAALEREERGLLRALKSAKPKSRTRLSAVPF